VHDFARPRNATWMNAHTDVVNTRRTKVGTTMNRHQCLRGPAEMVSEMAVMHIAVRREDADVVRHCRSGQSRVRVETANLAT
jgi:hypothetical protein